MTVVLVASGNGCRVFNESEEREAELDGLPVGALTPEAGGDCLAVVDETEVWRRNVDGAWSKVADSGFRLQSILSVGGTTFGGGMDEAVMVRISAGGRAEPLTGFESVPGRSAWFAGGPPLGVRSLAATADSSAILAAVHVGGIPRSADGGENWTPTIPIAFDVHEVRSHPLLPNLVAAATAVGLCVSRDGGLNWSVFADGPETPYSLAVALLGDEVLFATSDGPFAGRSQIWRWRVGGKHLEQVRDGLPEWLEGKVDTGGMAAGRGRVAILDGGGNLYLSAAGSGGWTRIATGIGYSFGVLIL